MRRTVVNTFLELAETDERFVFLTADLGYMMVEPIRRRLGTRFVNVGVSEANMIGVAAGMAKEGFKPVVYTMSQFVTLRCLEQIRVLLCQDRNNVILVGIGAGYCYGSQGPSHHAIEELAAMIAMPAMKVFVPADSFDVKYGLPQLTAGGGSAYIRLAKSEDECFCDASDREFQLGVPSKIRDGEQIAIFCSGAILKSCLAVADRLYAEQGISIAVFNVHSLKPFDTDYFVNIVAGFSHVITVETHVIHGGLGSIVATILATRGIHCRLQILGIRDEYKKVAGSKEYLERLDGLDEESILEAVMAGLAEQA